MVNFNTKSKQTKMFLETSLDCDFPGNVCKSEGLSSVYNYVLLLDL